MSLLTTTRTLLLVRAPLLFFKEFLQTSTRGGGDLVLFRNEATARVAAGSAQALAADPGASGPGRTLTGWPPSASASSPAVTRRLEGFTRALCDSQATRDVGPGYVLSR